MVIKKIFNRRWWWTTLLVIVAIGVLVRLGLWQLDRREQRTLYNTEVVGKWNQEPYDLKRSGIPTNLDDLAFRRVQVQGEFDYANEIFLKNQTRNGSPGVVVVTPLRLNEEKAVLISRGWLPLDRAAPEVIEQYQETAGLSVIGVVHESQLLPSGEAPEIPTEPQKEWFRINVDAIQAQVPYTLLPVFVEQMPDEDRAYSTLPFREEPWNQLREPSMHLNYAIQWFLFAVILGFGYIQYIRYYERREARIQQLEAEGADGSEKVHESAPIGGVTQSESHV